MDFLPTVSVEPTNGEIELWQRLKAALRSEDGFACLRYPIFPSDASYRYEPDILMLHRKLGLVIIEVKDCRAWHVAGLLGHTWHMRNWHSPTIAPYEQAQKQLWALKRHLDGYPGLSQRLHLSALVCLPFVAEGEWEELGYTRLPCNPPILFENQLTPARLRRRLQSLIGEREPVSDADWEIARQVLGLRPVLERGKQSEDVTPQADLIAMVRRSEAAIPQLDLEQLAIGMEIPPGPQRIRGIAGSGKTLLLAMKAARMHLSHPDWTIAFTFNTQSLYELAREQITRFCRHFGDRDPDWSRLQVMHCWGNKERPGALPDARDRRRAPSAFAQPEVPCRGQPGRRRSMRRTCRSSFWSRRTGSMGRSH